MIKLGTFDSEVQPAALDAYIKHAKHLTGVDDWQDKLRGEAESEWVDFEKLPEGEMTVKEAQSFFKQAGFFPFGKVDGICGYRTNSAIRLFQEYVRTVEGNADIGFPDGRFGPKSASHARRWRQEGKKADWAGVSANNPSPEYSLWLDLLNQFKQHHATNPSAMLKLVNAFSKPTDTVKPAQWDFDPNKIHLIGVRRNEGAASVERLFDDFFVLLINGLVFKFRGSTDPGETANPKGLPFLVMGQHHYRFAWHLLSKQHRVYHALKPLRHGVLVVRSKNDKALTDDDLDKGLECNISINVHWGGIGDGNVKTWSEGCQVFTGKAYINHQDKLIDCSKFAAPSYATLGKTVNGVYQTKGAYAVLTDLVAALSGGAPDDNIVRYTMLYERDLALSPAIGVDKAKEIAARFKS